jgi:hypothetical protein
MADPSRLEEIFPRLGEPLATLWSIAKKGNSDDLFELRIVERDTPPIDVDLDVDLPDKFLVLKDTANALFRPATVALITVEYVRILMEVINFYIDPTTVLTDADHFGEIGDDEGLMDVDEPKEAQLLLAFVKRNPFKDNHSLQRPRRASGFILLGNPGIGEKVSFSQIQTIPSFIATLRQDRVVKISPCYASPRSPANDLPDRPKRFFFF